MAKTGTFLSIAESQEGASPSIVTPYNPLPVSFSSSGDYKASDVDASGGGGGGSPNYYGFLKSNGNWYILKEEAGAYRYIFGTSGYTTNWTNRASLSYEYYDVAT